MSEMPAIDLKPNGPLLVRNLTVLENSKGERLATEAVIALCRCGGSGKKPFCDGTHKQIGFSDAGAAERAAEAKEGGVKVAAEGADVEPPAVTVTRNGPYRVVGAVDLAGRSLAGASYSLCRCGGSKTKPFCDGSHKQNGFEDERN